MIAFSISCEQAAIYNMKNKIIDREHLNDIITRLNIQVEIAEFMNVQGDVMSVEPVWSLNKKKEKSGDFYLSATAAGYFSDSPKGVDDEPLYGLRFGYDF